MRSKYKCAIYICMTLTNYVFSSELLIKQNAMKKDCYWTKPPQTLQNKVEESIKLYHHKWKEYTFDFLANKPEKKKKYEL